MCILDNPLLWCPAVEEMNHNTLPRSSLAEQMCYLQADCSRFAQSKQFIVNLRVETTSTLK